MENKITRSYNRSDIPRFQWTDDLDGHFAYAVQKLGGETSATPKRIWKLMNRPDVTISIVKSHLQIYRTIKKEERKQEKRQAYLRARLTRHVIRRQTQLHLRLYERFREAAFSFRDQQRQEEKMEKMTMENGEPSNVTQEVSCNSLYQSSNSTVGVNETGENGEDNCAQTKTDVNDDENSCVELVFGLKYQS